MTAGHRGALTRSDRVRGRTCRTATALVLVAGFLVATGHAASASPDVASAQAQAQALAAQVSALESRAEVATEHYDAVSDQLGGVITESILATERLDALTGADAATQDQATQRISAIYMAGSELSLYATVLDGSSPDDLVSRLYTVQSLVGHDQLQVDSAAQAVTDATATEARLSDLTTQRQGLERRAAQARDAVTTLLADRSRALAAANATVVRLAAQDQAAAEAQAESEAASAIDPGGQPLGDVAPGNPYAVAAIAAAHSKLGVPYVWGATGPDSFDCSGLVQWAYAQAGLHLMRVAADQWRSGPQVPLAALAPGDLLFWATDPAVKSTIHHVALYVGDGQMIEAPHTGAFVRLVPIRTGPEFAGAVRPGLPAGSRPTA